MVSGPQSHDTHRQNGSLENEMTQFINRNETRVTVDSTLSIVQSKTDFSVCKMVIGTV